MLEIFDREGEIAPESARPRQPPPAVPTAIAIGSGMIAAVTSMPKHEDSELPQSARSAPAQIARASAEHAQLLGKVPSFQKVACLDLDGYDENDVAERRILHSAGFFNARHKKLTVSARGLLTTLSNSTGAASERRQLAQFQKSLDEVKRNRFVLQSDAHDLFGPAASSPKSFRRKEKWRLEGSVWHPRKLSGNSRDYYETPESLRKLFDHDWYLAQRGSLSEAMVERDHFGTVWDDASGHSTTELVGDTREVLWEFHQTIYGAFDYFSSIMSDEMDDDGELVGVWSISFLEYIEFCRGCELQRGGSSDAALEAVWLKVNELDPTSALIDRFNHATLMVRHEFLQALVRIAMLLYMGDGSSAPAGRPTPAAEQRHAAGGTVGLVHEAVRQLMLRVQASLPPEAQQNSNAFRQDKCHQPLVDYELRKAHSSLQSVFNVYARSNKSGLDELQSSVMMSMGEWIAFLEHIAIFDMNQLSLFGAKMVFKWSRIRTLDDFGAESEVRHRNLFFEDFLEAVVRVACAIALPTDAELSASGAADAGAFLLALRDGEEQASATADGGGSALERFVNARKVGWQREPPQAVTRCVRHFVSFVTRIIEDNAPKAVADHRLSEDEVEGFERRRRSGLALDQLAGAAALLDGIHAAAAIVRHRLLSSLQKVEIFAELSAQQLEALRDAMVDAPFNRGEYVFEQGEEGDAFYIVQEGEAVVLRTEGADEPDVALATLGAGDVFGERALLKRQVRYASVMASSPKLHTMSITREQFEAVLGLPLEQLIPDKFKLDKMELLLALRQVDLFSGLSEEQLFTLMGGFKESEFAMGKWVFRQGDSGDDFHVIIAGEAEVMRSEGSRKPQRRGTLSQWRVFGERALLTDSKRYVGVRAKSFKLKTLHIDRAGFERVLGPINDLLPAAVQYS